MSIYPIIDGMKGRICPSLFWSHGDLKKSFTINQVINGFFRPVTSFSSSRQYSFPCFVAGFEPNILTPYHRAIPATVFSYALHILRGGRFPVQVLLARVLHRGVRRFIVGSYRKVVT